MHDVVLFLLQLYTIMNIKKYMFMYMILYTYTLIDIIKKQNHNIIIIVIEEKMSVVVGNIFNMLCFLIYRPFDAKNPYLAPVKVNRELHKGGDRSCMHIEFDISGSKIR